MIERDNSQGGILGNSRVRLSDPWKKSIPRKIFEILFWPETSKNDHSRRWGEEGRVLLCRPVNVPFYFPKMPFLLRIAFLYSRSAFLFPEISRVFQKCLSISQKCPTVFQNCPLVFQKSFLFILRAFFQERLLFPANCTFSSPYSEQLRVGRGEGTALLLFFPPWNSLLTDL